MQHARLTEPQRPNYITWTHATMKFQAFVSWNYWFELISGFLCFILIPQNGEHANAKAFHDIVSTKSMLQPWPWRPIFAIWMSCVPPVVSICEDVSLGAWWDAWQQPGVSGIQHLALTARDRCPFVAFIRRIRLERPSFRVLDIGAVGYPWSIHSGVADVIFDFQATNLPNCFLTDDMARAEACCSSLDDQCFDKLFTRERCCRGKQPVFVGMIDGDVTNVEGAGWAKMCLI